MSAALLLHYSRTATRSCAATLDKRVDDGDGRPPEAAELGDILSAVAFLASEDARFITGVDLPVDGGTSASNGQPPLS